MKRNYIPFIAGMSTMLLLVGLVGASLAGETRPPAVPLLSMTLERAQI